MRLVCGVGINDRKYPSKANGAAKKEYTLWSAMIRRCYAEKALIRNQTYIECTVSENFKSYSYFYEWCQNQIGFGINGWDLDKDILIKGNKIYSEDICVFLPSCLNTITLSVKSRRGQYPIGITYKKDKRVYAARIEADGKRVHCGSSVDMMKAFAIYKKAKESHIKIKANEYRGVIDPRAYDALMKYEVEITD